MAEDACKMKQKRMRKRMLRTRSMMRKVSMMSMMMMMMRRRRKSVKGGITMVRVFFPTWVPFIFSIIVKR